MRRKKLWKNRPCDRRVVEEEPCGEHCGGQAWRNILCMKGPLREESWRRNLVREDCEDGQWKGNYERNSRRILVG